MKIDPGFDPNKVLLGQFYLNTNGYTLAQRKEFCRRLEERMRSAPALQTLPTPTECLSALSQLVGGAEDRGYAMRPMRT